METKLYDSDPLLSLEDLVAVAGLIREGELVAIPTETVYGLAADLFCELAVKKIFQVKGRASDNPLIAHICDLSEVERMVVHPSELFFRLADSFWPGPLTLVAERAEGVPLVAVATLSTIAVRMPAHPCARQIIQAVGSPLVAPSANRSGAPSATSAQDVLEDFAGKISAVVDGGISSLGIESTVVGVFGDHPVLLRPGAISREAVEEVLKVPLKKAEGEIRAPGMKYRHYAPRAKVVLVKEGEREERAYTPSDLSAKNLYAHFRKADRLGYSLIAIPLTPEIRCNEALMDRLVKAVSAQ